MSAPRLSDAFPLVGHMVLMLVATSIGAIAIVSEYSSGRTPRRGPPFRPQLGIVGA